MELRERIENNEDLTLIPQAIHSNKSMGRELKEKYDSIPLNHIVHCDVCGRNLEKRFIRIRNAFRLLSS
jgi:dGTPase